MKRSSCVDGGNYTERKLVEIALKESEMEYRSLLKNMLSGLAYHKIIVDDPESTD